MAYTTANKTTSGPADPADPQLQSVTADVEQAQGAPETRIDRVLRMAEGTVKDLAPPPAGQPRPEDYRQAAADAEIAVFEYIWDTRGIVSSQSSLVGSSVSYQSDPQVLKIVSQTMGKYAGGNKAYVGRLRR